MILVLDLDDTLYPESEYALSGFAAVGHWLKVHSAVEDFELHARELFLSGVHDHVFDRTLDLLNLPVTEDLIRTLVQVYRDHEPTITLHPDARWALDHFGSSVDLGMITDGFLQSQKRKIHALGIAPLFRTIVYSDEMGRDHWKPSQTPYLRLMNESGLPGSSCIYVSDNPAKDFVAAIALGWHTIRIRREDGIYSHLEAAPGYEPHREISSLYQLDGILQSISDVFN
ncbi:MAG: HAD family hydrolase [Thermomicrobiales bacterium]